MKTCEHCGTDFEPSQTQSKYCSRICKSRAARLRRSPEALREQKRKYREKNPNKLREARRLAYQKNRDSELAGIRAYYAANAEHIRARARARRSSDVEAYRAKARARWEACRDEMSEKRTIKRRSEGASLSAIRILHVMQQLKEDQAE